MEHKLTGSTLRYPAFNPTVQAIVSKYQVVVWWATPIEIRGALARLVRTGRLTLNQQVGAQVRLETLRRNWREVFPSDKVREKAESLVDRFQLTGADALQLGAAWTWCDGHPHDRAFISGDRHLLDAARQLGFTAIEG